MLLGLGWKVRLGISDVYTSEMSFGAGNENHFSLAISKGSFIDWSVHVDTDGS